MFNTAIQRREAAEQRRQLHARIARSRRRIGRQTSQLGRGSLLPGAWKQQIQEHPIVALATAAGVGMLVAQLTARTGAVHRATESLAQWLAGGRWAEIIKLLERFFASDDATTAASSAEPDHA